MNITVRIALTQGQQIRPGKLNEAIKAVATKEWSGRHDAVTVIVDCDDADEAAIRAVIDTHLATDWASQEGSVVSRIVTDEAERLQVRGETGTLAWLNLTPDQSEQWVLDKFQERVTAGDSQVQAALWVMKKIVRFTLPALRAYYRKNASGETALSQGAIPK